MRATRESAVPPTPAVGTIPSVATRCLDRDAPCGRYAALIATLPLVAMLPWPTACPLLDSPLLDSRRSSLSHAKGPTRVCTSRSTSTRAPPPVRCQNIESRTYLGPTSDPPHSLTVANRPDLDLLRTSLVPHSYISLVPRSYPSLRAAVSSSGVAMSAGMHSVSSGATVGGDELPFDTADHPRASACRCVLLPRSYVLRLTSCLLSLASYVSLLNSYLSHPATSTCPFKPTVSAARTRQCCCSRAVAS